MMEMDSKPFKEEMEKWEPGYGLLEEDLWSPGLLNNFGGEPLLEGESFWNGNDNDDLLKELKAKAAAASEPLPQSDYLLDDWVDEVLDLETVDELMNSPEFEGLFEHFCKGPLDVFDPIAEESNGSTSSGQEDDYCCMGQNGHSCDLLQPQIIVVEAIDGQDLLLGKSTVISDDVFVTINTATAADLQILPSISIDSPPELKEETPEAEELHPTVSVSQVSANVQTAASSKTPTPPVVAFESSCSDDSRPSSPLKMKVTRKNPRRKKPYSFDDDQQSPSTSSGDDEPVASSSKSLRKRGQNRTAASKYRQKKKLMVDSLSKEEDELTARNKELLDKANQLSNEVGYLKGLMKEILIAKGLIKPKN